MKRYSVRLTGRFLSDLAEIAKWLAAETSLDFALSFTADIESYCQSFEYAPLRSTAPAGLGSPFRVVTFRQSVQIAYEVGEDEVTVLRASYRGRDVMQLLSADYPSRSSE